MKNEIDMQRLELLMRGAEPEDEAEIAFTRCYVGTIVNEPLFDIGKGLTDALDIDKLTTHDWKYVFLGLVLGDKDYRDSIKDDKQTQFH